jgi:hypothetical protein
MMLKLRALSALSSAQYIREEESSRSNLYVGSKRYVNFHSFSWQTCQPQERPDLPLPTLGRR